MFIITKGFEEKMVVGKISVTLPNNGTFYKKINKIYVKKCVAMLKANVFEMVKNRKFYYKFISLLRFMVTN